MRRALTLAALALAGSSSCRERVSDVCGESFCLSVGNPQHADGVGAAQGVEFRDGVLWIYGDASTGRMRSFRLTDSGTLESAGEEIAFTVGGTDRAPHPTGLSFHDPEGTFLGNTVAQKGEILAIDWEAARAAHTLDGAIRAVSVDDAGKNGARPELVRVRTRWLVATADYGGGETEVRLYEPAALSAGTSTATPGVVVARFPVTGYVQTLHYWEARDVLVLVQNRHYGSGWRLTLVDLAGSVETGEAVVLDVLEPELLGELEGFHFVDGSRALMVTSAGFNNAWPATLTAKR